MTVDNVSREQSPVTKEAVADPKFRFGGLLVEGDAWTNPRVNIITDFVFMAGRESAHPFLRLPERGRCAQGGYGCIAAVGEEVCKVPFRFRRLKHELFVIAPQADSALGLEALDDLKDLASPRKINWRSSALAFAAHHMSIWPSRFSSFAAIP